MGFKKDFIWGTATAAYQVEGAAYEDGKGLSIWDTFCKEEGRIYENQNGDVACDQYHRYKEDIKLMKELGIKAYRFSICWARILPDGFGKINEKGLEYYDNLINELLANDITPFITLYHWDLPYELHRRGGWLNPEMQEYFYNYASIIAEHYSDRVKYFFTLNEPQVTVGLGYKTGDFAPGLTVGLREYFEIYHNLLKAHGRAVQALREKSKQPVQVGIASCGSLYYPASNSRENIEAARKMMFHIQNDDIMECNWNASFTCDPIFLGKYPEEISQYFSEYMPDIKEGDMELISQPLDFFGQNMYNAVEIKADENGNPVRAKRYDGFPKTAIQWPVTPECLYWGPKYFYERYKKPIFITENGMSAHDWVSLDGKVHDPNRIDFLHRYLSEMRRAAEDGVDVAGYFEWSMMDNFEWAKGFSERFGTVFVNYNTQERIPKDSAFYYKSVIDSNGNNL